MRIFVFQNSLQKHSAGKISFFLALFFISFTSYSQTRAYTRIYSDNMKGGSTIFGNTLMNIVTDNKVDFVKMNDSSDVYGNDVQDMEYIDIDGNSGFGSVTRNSSSAALILPPGTNTIKLAKLYWGGRIANTDFDLTKTENKTVKIRKGTEDSYSNVMAINIDTIAIVPGFTEYLASADITDFIKNNGAGTYEVGNVPLSTGAVGDGGNHGGWSIVVVYENNALPYNSVRVYDGFQSVYNGGNPVTSMVTLTGLDVPSGSIQAGDAKMGVVALEGDANLPGDYLLINGNIFSNATNPPFNPWNGTISNNGVPVHTKSPDYVNQMGIDIDMFDVGSGYGILPNANSVTLEFGTQADKYFPCVFTFTIRMKDPTINLEKTVSDANNDHLAESGEILTYTLKGANNGIGSANNIVLRDTLPNTVTYKPGSLKVISAPGVASGLKTDNAGDDIAEYLVNGPTKSVVFRIGTGATSVAGGTLAANETYEVQFQVTVNDPGAGIPVPPIMNIARITSSSDAGVNFVDDGTAIMNPEAGPLPVTLVKFSGNLLSEHEVKLDWATTMEINCSRFVIQRSYNGIAFTDVGTVAGNGTTNLFHSYTENDHIYSFTGSVVYYRLKQIDLDRKESFSNIVPVKIKKTSQLITVSPNPFKDFMNVNVEWNKAESVAVKIFNVQGKEVFSKKIQMNSGNNFLKIDKLANLPNGNYLLQFISSSQNVVQKITK